MIPFLGATMNKLSEGELKIKYRDHRLVLAYMKLLSLNILRMPLFF